MVEKYILYAEYKDTRTVKPYTLLKTWEIALNKIGPNPTTIVTGDINIDIIKFKNVETCNYLSTLLSYP